MDKQEFQKELNELINLAESWDMEPLIIRQQIDDVFKCGNEITQNHIIHIHQKLLNKSLFINSMLYIVNLLRLCVFSIVKLIFYVIVIYTIISCHNPTQKFVMRHSQTLIYPVMRSARLLTLPVIRKYYYLTEWHEEECLLKNPFYQEPLLDCWPCEDVRTIVDLTGLVNYTQAYCFNERPFLVKDVMADKITYSDLNNMYNSHETSMKSGTAKFISNLPEIEALEDLFLGSKYFQEKSAKNLHIVWKVNRVSAARVVRELFRRPYFVPNNSEVALQRYIFFDGPESAPYFFPLTDFANVWLAQGQGYRLIVLDPTEPCKTNCSSISVLLKPKDVMYYNWQFWRPRSLPTRLSDELSITYMSSFY